MIFWLFRKTYTLSIIPFGVNWGWHAKAKNGEIVASGEGYSRREDAERAAKALCAARLVFKE